MATEKGSRKSKVFVEADGDEFLLGHDGQLGDRRGLGEHDALVDGDLRLDLQHLAESVAHMVDRFIDGPRAAMQGEKGDGRRRGHDQANAEVMLHE